MSLVTPEKIRSLQRKLYVKAKAEPTFRFYVLYDKVCRTDILLHAYKLARFNAGAPGVDGVTFAQIEASGLEAWLVGLREELVAKTYRPGPVRRVMIPKASSDGERPLGIVSSKPLPRSRWSRSSRPTSRTLLTAIALVVGRWLQSRKCTGILSGATPMSLMLIYRAILILFRTRTS